MDAQFGLFVDRANLDPRQDARFAWNVPYAQKLIWTYSIELVDDVCRMESRFGVLRDSISFGAR